MARLFFTLFLIGCTTISWGQSASQKKLEKRKAQILKEIKSLNSMIAKQDKKEKSVLSQISDSEAKIKLSEKLINTTNKQTQLLSDDISSNEKKMAQLQGELQLLREDYAKMLQQAYKSRSEQSRIMLILSSDNFLEAYKRVQYMKQYASFRKVQGDEIRGKMLLLSELGTQLETQKDHKEKLLAEREQEKETLEQDKDEKEKLVKSIQQNKKKYAADIQKKQKEAKEIDRKVDNMIREAIAAANRREAAKKAAREKAALAAAKKAKEEEAAKKAVASKSGTTKKTATEKTVAAKKTEVAKAAPAKEVSVKTSNTTIELTKEDKALAGSFVANKGHMPRPVDGGFVSSPFGKQASPIEKSAIIDNHGIDITAPKGADVKAVFKGEVVLIQVISGSIKAVTIRHGDYMTIYFNLENISVKTGDNVTTGQKIGNVHTSPSGKTVFKFYVVQNTKFLNPQSWVRI